MSTSACHQCSIRQVDEKHLATEVELMLWSPKMDLIAVSNILNEVILYRLSWQKVWTLPSPGDEVKVTALSWRPDGKVVAVGYSTGHMILCDIENADILHSADIIGGISHMTWISQVFAPDAPWTFKPYTEDNIDTFVPKLQPHTKSYDASKKGHSEEPVDDNKKLKNQKELNVLIVGTCTDCAHLYAYGVFPVAVIQLPTSDQSTHIVSGLLSRDLTQLSLVVKYESCGSAYYQYLIFETPILLEKHKELRLLALKYGHLYSLLDYLSETVKLMCEAWEDILVEMDKKLLKFAEEKQNFGVGTVSNDFLELLMFGTASSQLEAFLLHGLTEKGLKKLGHSIETSYSNIQKLVVKHLRNVSHTILYETSELRGLSRWTLKYGPLGLDTDLMEAAIQSAGSFVLKTSELQQVIDGSITNFKAFFRWLYVAILRLSDQVPHTDISKMTQYDINFVAEFLKDSFAHFSEDEEVASPTHSSNSKQGFKLEKVGQYLKDEDLCFPAKVAGNPWVKFLHNSTYTKDSSLLYPTESQKSLIQLQHKLCEALHDSLTQPSKVIGNSTKLCGSVRLFDAPTGEDNSQITFTQCNVGEYLYTAFTSSSGDRLYLVRHLINKHSDGVAAEIASAKLIYLPFEGSSPDDDSFPNSGHLEILDVSFYDETTLSLLVQAQDTNNTPALVQLPLASISHLKYTTLETQSSVLNNITVTDISECIDSSNYLVLSNMKAGRFAVSGTRKVACVLFSSRRRVRLYLMDADDDDEDETLDETDTTQNVTGMEQQSCTVTEGEDKENIGVS